MKYYTYLTFTIMWAILVGASFAQGKYEFTGLTLLFLTFNVVRLKRGE